MPQSKGCEKPAGSGKPQGHPVGRPMGALGKELKPRKTRAASVTEDSKDFEALLTGGAKPLFEIPGIVDNPPEEFITEEDILEEAKIRLAYMNSDDSVKRYVMRELSIDEKEAVKKIAALRKDLNKEFNDYIKGYSKENIMAVRYMLKGALKRGDLRNSTDIIKALDYMTTKYVENTGVDKNEIEVVL